MANKEKRSLERISSDLETALWLQAVSLLVSTMKMLTHG